MLTRLFAIAAVAIAVAAIFLSARPPSGLYVRDERPPYGTRYSGRYQNGRWVPAPSRRSYGGFRGGGPGVGK